MTALDPNVQNRVNDLVIWFRNLEKLQNIAMHIVPNDVGTTLQQFAAIHVEILCQGNAAQCVGNKTALLRGCKDQGITPQERDVSLLANLNQTFLEALNVITGNPVETLFLRLFSSLAAQYKPACINVLREFTGENFADSLRDTAGDALLTAQARADFLAILSGDLQPFHLPWTPGGRRVFDTPGRKLRDEINLLLGKEMLK